MVMDKNQLRWLAVQLTLTSILLEVASFSGEKYVVHLFGVLKDERDMLDVAVLDEGKSIYVCDKRGAKNSGDQVKGRGLLKVGE